MYRGEGAGDEYGKTELHVYMCIYTMNVMMQQYEYCIMGNDAV